MKLTYLNRMLVLLMLCCTAIYSQEAPRNYGKPGDFELSAGLSGSTTYNGPGYQQYMLRLLPFANHFLFEHIFLRYELGLSIGYSRADYLIGDYYVAWGANPGLAVGYSFGLSSNWHLNLALGYGIALSQFLYNDGSGSTFTTQQSIRFYPELKYFITDRWSLSLLLQGNGRYINYTSNTGNIEITTNTYIVASYRL